MAGKRITTVDEILNIDPDADYLLVSRGVQQDLRRILLRRLPPSFDIHDNVTDELATLAGIDRIVVSDEGTPGAPQKFVRLSTLRSFLLDLFDLHDDVPTELTKAAGDDRLVISDESENGDPQKFITVTNLARSLPGLMNVQKLTTEISLQGHNERIAHDLGKTPLGFQERFICKTAEGGYSPGDEIFSWVMRDYLQDASSSQNYSRYYTTIATIFDVDGTHFSVRTSDTTYDATPFAVRKDSSNTFSLSLAKWRIGLTIFG